MKKLVRKRYEALKKKYGLPKFDELDSEFEISTLEHEDFLLSAVRKKIMEKVGDASCLLEEVLHPDTNLADLYESRVFDEDEKKGLFEIYKRLMFADRYATELSISNDEKLDADFVKSFTAEWRKLKPDLVKFIRKLKESWEKETEEGEVAGYMG